MLGRRKSSRRPSVTIDGTGADAAQENELITSSFVTHVGEDNVGATIALQSRPSIKKDLELVSELSSNILGHNDELKKILQDSESAYQNLESELRQNHQSLTNATMQIISITQERDSAVKELREVSNLALHLQDKYSKALQSIQDTDEIQVKLAETEANKIALEMLVEALQNQVNSETVMKDDIERKEKTIINENRSLKESITAMKAEYIKQMDTMKETMRRLEAEKAKISSTSEAFYSVSDLGQPPVDSNPKSRYSTLTGQPAPLKPSLSAEMVMQADIEDLKQALETVRGQNEDYKQQIDQLKTSILYMKEENTRLLQEMKLVESINQKQELFDGDGKYQSQGLNEVSILKKRLEDSETVIREKVAELLALTQFNDEHVAQLHLANKNSADLGQKLHDAELLFATTMGEINTFKPKIELLEASLEVSCANLVKKEAELKEAYQTNDVHSKDLAALKRSAEIVSQRLQTTEALLSEKIQLIESMEVSYKQLQSEFELQTVVLMNQSSKSTFEQGRKEAQIQQLQEKLSETESQLDNAIRDKKVAEDSLSQAQTKLSKLAEDIQYEKSSAAEVVSRLQLQIDHILLENTELKQTMAQNHAEWNRKIEDLHLQLVDEQVQKLVIAKEKSEALFKFEASTKLLREEKLKAVEELQSEIARTKTIGQQLTNITERNKVMSCRCEEYERKLDELNEFIASLKKDAETRSELFKADSEASKVEFEKTITSLKNDIVTANAKMEELEEKYVSELTMACGESNRKIQELIDRETRASKYMASDKETIEVALSNLEKVFAMKENELVLEKKLVSSLKDDNDNQKQLNAQTQSKLVALTAELEKGKTEYTELQASHNLAQEELISIRAKLEAALIQMGVLHEALDKCRISIDEKEGTILYLQKQLVSLSEQIKKESVVRAELESQIVIADKKLELTNQAHKKAESRFTEAQVNLNNKIEGLVSNLDDAQKLLTDAQSLSAQHQSQAQQLKQQLDVSTQKTQALETRLYELSKSYESARAQSSISSAIPIPEFEQLQTKYAEIKKELEQSTGLVKLLELKLIEARDALKKEKAISAGSYLASQEFKALLDGAIDEKNAQQAEVDKLEKEVGALRLELKTSLSTQTKLETQLSNAIKRIHSLTQDNTDLGTRIDSLLEKINQYQSGNNLEAQLTEMENRNQQDIDRIKKQQESQIVALSVELSVANGVLETERQLGRDKLAELDALKAHIVELELQRANTINDVGRIHEERSDLERRLSAVKLENWEKDTQIDILTKTLEEKQAKDGNLVEEARSDEQCEISVLNARIISLSKELDSSQKALGKLHSKMKFNLEQSQKAQKQFDSVNSVISEIIGGSASQTQSTMEILKSTVASYQQAIESLVASRLNSESDEPGFEKEAKFYKEMYNEFKNLCMRKILDLEEEKRITLGTTLSNTTDASHERILETIILLASTSADSQAQNTLSSRSSNSVTTETNPAIALFDMTLTPKLLWEDIIYGLIKLESPSREYVQLKKSKFPRP